MMVSESVKGKPLTREESNYLLDLIENSKILLRKATNATNNKMKSEEWVRVADQFNATFWPRTPQQLRLKWENFKKNSRRRSSLIKINQNKSDGDPADYIPPDEILDRVTAILDRTACNGLSMPVGVDKEASGDSVGPVRSYGDDDIGDVTVTTVDVTEILNRRPPSIDKDQTVVDGNQVLDAVDQNKIHPNKTKQITHQTAARKKWKPNEGRTARNVAIAQYYLAKKRSENAKLQNIKLENENFKLKNLELRLSNEKLMLEVEKLKLELEKLRKEQ